MLNRTAVEEREERLRLQIRELPESIKEDYFKLAKAQMKDPDTYAALNYISIAGLHHFYLQRWGRGCFNLGVFCFGLVMVVLGTFGAPFNLGNVAMFYSLGVASLVVIAVLELPALFASQVIVQDYNNDVTERLLREIGVIGKPIDAGKPVQQPFGHYETSRAADNQNPYRDM